jgi:FkbM family methyltransferase
MKLDYLSKNARYWLLRQSRETVARNFNRFNAVFWKYPIRLSMAPEADTLLVEDQSARLRFVHPDRVTRYSRQGIQAFLRSLESAYMIDQVPLSRGDWVIDCGANIGELSMALLNRQPGLNIVAIEPEAAEADCADANIFGGERRTVRKVLWKEEATMRFFSAAETADSSLFQPPTSHTVREIQATTLNSLVTQLGCDRIRLLKLEAEGAEPEILQGADLVLQKIDYIAADLGPERGLKQEETATPVINHLLSCGFELIGMRFDRVTCLFRNRVIGAA